VCVMSEKCEIRSAAESCPVQEGCLNTQSRTRKAERHDVFMLLPEVSSSPQALSTCVKDIPMLCHTCQVSEQRVRLHVIVTKDENVAFPRACNTGEWSIWSAMSHPLTGSFSLNTFFVFRLLSVSFTNVH
jgi:hypothetical protein